MYWSPSRRISLGKCLRCALSSLLYSGIGGNSARGAGLKPRVVPADVGVAIRNRGLNFILRSSSRVHQVELHSRRGQSVVVIKTSEAPRPKHLAKKRSLQPRPPRLRGVFFDRNKSKREEETMLPTPSTSHVPYERVYEPAEDSFLFLDTLSSESEKAFLQQRFSHHSPTSTLTHSSSPFVVELGTGSGVILSFINAHAVSIFGRQDIFTAGVDVNRFACKATVETVRLAAQEQDVEALSHGFYLGNILGDLTSSMKPEQVDVLIFNPPYVPTSELPRLPDEEARTTTTYEADSHLLSLSYAGGIDGMETTTRLLQSLPEVLNCSRGCAYILLCAQNKPEEVKEQIKSWGGKWAADVVGTTGKKGGWENLQILRIWRT